MKNTSRLSVTVLFSLSVSGCQTPEGLVAGNSAVTVHESQVEAPGGNPTDPGQAVCDPFGSQGSVSSERGLIASMKYIPNGNTGMYRGVEDFMQKADPVDVSLFFNQLNVPTRPFDLGFVTQDGTVLKTPQGHTLYEFFSLSFDSVIRLRDGDDPGLYQFAVLSDDGTILQVNSDGTGMRDLIVNDGDHATRLGCASSVISMDRSTRLPIHLDYYQGPRYHIALILLWRKVPDASSASLSDSACGVTGNDIFFRSTTNPIQALPTWLGMLSRGWKVVTPESYYLPRTSSPNPCVTATPSPGVTVAATPSPSTSPSASPSPTPSPSASSSPQPSPTPSSCSGPFCGGGILGS